MIFGHAYFRTYDESCVHCFANSMNFDWFFGYSVILVSTGLSRLKHGRVCHCGCSNLLKACGYVTLLLFALVAQVNKRTAILLEKIPKLIRHILRIVCMNTD